MRKEREGKWGEKKEPASQNQGYTYRIETHCGQR